MAAIVEQGKYFLLFVTYRNTPNALSLTLQDSHLSVSHFAKSRSERSVAGEWRTNTHCQCHLPIAGTKFEYNRSVKDRALILLIMRLWIRDFSNELAYSGFVGCWFLVGWLADCRSSICWRSLCLLATSSYKKQPLILLARVCVVFIVCYLPSIYLILGCV